MSHSLSMHNVKSIQLKSCIFRDVAKSDETMLDLFSAFPTKYSKLALMKSFAMILVLAVTLAFASVAASQEDAHYALAVEEYKNGRNVDKIISHLKNAAHSTVKAHAALGHIYAYRGDYTNAFKSHLEAAKAKNVFSQQVVGLSYYSGLGVDKNLSKSYEWYIKGYGKKPEDIDFPVYLENSPYFKVNKDFNKHIMEEASGGNASLQHIMALKILMAELFLSESGQPQFALAESWLLKSAKARFIYAQLMLAEFYESGVFGEGKLDQARYWIEQAFASADINKLDEEEEQWAIEIKNRLSKVPSSSALN